MENFDTNGTPQRVREKSVYLLHLDTPRIIIISALIIGAVVGSFLLGMNLMKNDTGDVSFAKNDLLIDEHKELGMLNNGLAGDEGSEQQRKAAEETPGADLPDPADRGQATAQVTTEEKSAPVSEGTGEQKPIANEQVAPRHEGTQHAEAQPRESSKTAHRKTDRKEREKRDIARRSDGERRESKRHHLASGPKDVVEVSSGVGSRKEEAGTYVIQIASYDKRSRALAEMRSLKEKHFEAFVDRTSLHGKQFFRVRIGPLPSMRAAQGVLSDIQVNARYENSYLVRE